MNTVEFFERLADTMNSQPERYDALGDVDIDLAVEIRTAEAEPFRVVLAFHGITCEVRADGSTPADCVLSGDTAAWRAMFDDIAEHGHATGKWTLNSLTLMGDAMTVDGDDPLGVDRFFRFNQTLQQFFEGSARERQLQ